MSNPHKVFIRTYCESGCICPTCHDGNHTTEVEKCAYCQLAWRNIGQYNHKWRAEQPNFPPLQEYIPSQGTSHKEETLNKIKDLLEQL